MHPPVLTPGSRFVESTPTLSMNDRSAAIWSFPNRNHSPCRCCLAKILWHSLSTRFARSSDEHHTTPNNANRTGLPTCKWRNRDFGFFPYPIFIMILRSRRTSILASMKYTYIVSPPDICMSIISRGMYQPDHHAIAIHGATVPVRIMHNRSPTIRAVTDVGVGWKFGPYQGVFPNGQSPASPSGRGNETKCGWAVGPWFRGFMSRSGTLHGHSLTMRGGPPLPRKPEFI